MADSTSERASSSDQSIESTAFDCNICLEQAKDPVVTLCGHLYCWPCLYRWLRVRNSSQCCPVCKAGVETDKVIPLYGRGCDQSDPRNKEVVIPQEESIPRRPAGQRPLAIQRYQNPFAQLDQRGFFHAFRGFAHHNAGNPAQRPFMTPEDQSQQMQVFIKRMGLLIGSFLFLYILMF